MEETSAPQAAPLVSHLPVRRDGWGTTFGLLVFFGGISLLLVTFDLAYQLFIRPPASALGLGQTKTLDLGKAGDSVATIVLRIALLVVMALVGSAIANRGISLYADARAHKQ